jgi:uncharacterized protein (TIGR00369 family)
MKLRPDVSIDRLHARAKGTLPEVVNFRVLSVEQGKLSAEIPVRPELLAPNGYLHAATVIALADTASGYGCIAHLPEGAESFTTIELKANFIGTAREGTIECVATLVHGGRTTQIWDATVRHRETGRVTALFRCTQMILWPKQA